MRDATILGSAPPPVRVHCFPSQDDDFARVAASVVDEHYDGAWRGAAGSGERTARAIERLLRRAYPSALIRRRQPFAAVAEPDAEMWYVFREGGAG